MARRVLTRKTACGHRGVALSCVAAGLRHHPESHLRKLAPSIASYLREVSSSSVTRDQDWVPTRRRPFSGSLWSGPSACTPVGGGWQEGSHADFKRTTPVPSLSGTLLSPFLSPLALEGMPPRLPQAQPGLISPAVLTRQAGNPCGDHPGHYKMSSSTWDPPAPMTAAAPGPDRQPHIRTLPSAPCGWNHPG